MVKVHYHRLILATASCGKQKEVPTRPESRHGEGPIRGKKQTALLARGSLFYFVLWEWISSSTIDAQFKVKVRTSGTASIA